MTRYVVDLELRGWRPGTPNSDPPDYTIPGTDVRGQLKHGRRLNGLVDEGSVTLYNTGGRYTGGSGYGGGLYSGGYSTVDVRDGDRLELWTQFEGESGLSRRWTAMVRYDRFERLEARESRAHYNLDDYVFGVLNFREIRQSYEDQAVAKAPSDGDDGILNEILQEEAPEIDRSGIETFSVGTSVYYTGKSLLDVVSDLASRGKAYAASDGTALVFAPLRDLSVDFTLTADDHGPLENQVNTSMLANEVRVDGGEQSAVDDEQTTQDSYQTVTASSRLTHQLQTRKSEVSRIELWTNPTGSGESVVVRLQADDGGSPQDPSSKETDIARRTLTKNFLASDDYTTFLIPEHTLPDRNPWVIVESSGSTGQDIGIESASGEPTYKAYYPYPLNSVIEDPSSQDKYRRRTHSVRDDNLQSRRATTDLASSTLRRRQQPASKIQFEARSNRAHSLAPGDLITVQEPVERVDGDYVVTETRDRYNADTNRLETTITARDLTTL